MFFCLFCFAVINILVDILVYKPLHAYVVIPWDKFIEVEL